MKWFFERLTISPKLTTQLLIASLFINILGLLSSVYVIQVYGRYLLHGVDGTLITLSSGMFIVIIFEFILRRIRYRMVMASTAKSERELGSSLFYRLLHAKTDDLMSMKPNMPQMVLQRNEQMQNTTTPSSFITFIDAPFAFIYILAIFFISPFIAWVVLAILLTSLLISLLMGFYIRKQVVGQLKAQVMKANVTNSAYRFETIRTAGAANFLQDAWEQGSGEHRWWRHSVGRIQELLHNSTHTFSMLMTLVVIALGAREVVSGDINFGMLIGINILAARALMLLTRPAHSIAPLLQAAQSRKLVDNFHKVRTEPPKGTKLATFSGNLEFANVTFGYAGGQGPLFENFSVKIPSGTFVKVVGFNGTGKTTVARLLANIISPRRGAILADGVDLRQLHPQWWRKQLVYLPQEPEFIEASLRDNLVFLNPDIDDDALQKIIVAADLSRFVNQHQDGLMMMINNGGHDLSLGIRRRLALARALVTEGSIVIIDDPTEGLDAQGIQSITKLLNQFMKQKRTIIVMSHDRESIKGEKITIDLSQKPVPLITGAAQ